MLRERVVVQHWVWVSLLKLARSLRISCKKLLVLFCLRGAQLLTLPANAYRVGSPAEHEFDSVMIALSMYTVVV